MQTIIPFDFATVVCDGCGSRVDSNISQDILRDYKMKAGEHNPFRVGVKASPLHSASKI